MLIPRSLVSRSLIRRSVPIVALLAVLALGATACSSSNSGGGGTTTAPATSESSSEGGGGEEAGGPGDIVAQNFAFTPTSFTAKSGDTISVQNKDSVQHTFTIKGTNVNQKLDAGETYQIKIDLKPGSYGWMCTIHPTMTGTLKVT